MITEREGKRLEKIRRAVTSRKPVKHADAQWALDLARREGAILRTVTVEVATKQGFDCTGIKTKE